ncbi:MAG: hypothetical protein P8Y18_10930 [Candidatus Bathyarchaeota archaeon]
MGCARIEDAISVTTYESVKDYMEETVTQCVRSDIENGEFNPTVKDIAERYGLEGVF